MMVFVAWSGEFDDAGIAGVFTNREAAERASRAANLVVFKDSKYHLEREEYLVVVSEHEVSE